MNYNHFAKDFSRTRYSVWKGVRNFLDRIQPESRNLEVGCGNGKNMLYLKDKGKEFNFKGIDLSRDLVKICKDKGLDTEEGDILNLSNEEKFDNVLAIAVIHHLRTRNERIKAISNLILTTKSGGRILIYVWATHQPENMKKRFQKFKDLGGGDKIVPFQRRDGETFERFYHFYQSGEIEEEIKDSQFSNQVRVENVYWEEGNWVITLFKLFC